MPEQTVTARDQDTARARYIAPGVLELVLRGRVALEVLRGAIRDLESLAYSTPGARQLLIDAVEFAAMERSVPATLAKWLTEHTDRFDHAAFVAGDNMARGMLTAIAANMPDTQTFIAGSRSEAFASLDDALARHAGVPSVSPRG
jgi:hypothetical protein